MRTYALSVSGFCWYATSAGSLYAPFTSRTRLPLVGEAAGVGLGAEEVGLDDAAGLREVLPQLLVDGEHRVEGGVVLGVERDGRTDGGGGLDDGPDVGEGELVAAVQRLAEEGQLHRHLGALAELQPLEAVDQLQVRVPGERGLLRAW